MTMCIDLVGGTCCNQLLSQVASSHISDAVPTKCAPNPKYVIGTTSTLCRWTMCGIKSIDASAVSQGMVLYNKIHKDITLRTQAERYCFGEFTSLSLSSLFLLFFPISFFSTTTSLHSTTPSHTDWLWWSWTGSRPTACQSTVRRQSQTSPQQ